ncbi:peptidoglycan DD-metalloendopeptidase family protein [Bacillus sp. BGMRC 2118]|nr:peptidoglycan DD-metalloendopeptidase family protein [Bacillus sp. BGMRC 2118]
MREEENKNPRKSKTNQFFKKRWVFPAIYLASAAIILTGVLWYQSSTNDLADSKGKIESNEPGTAMNGEDAVPVVSNVEKFSMPVVDVDSVEIQKHFYDSEASSEEQEAALVFYNNTYTENTGIDIVSKNGEAFDVVASLSGTVTEVRKDPMLGFVVELDHGDGVTTMYSALENVKVEEGASVAQGELLATAGRSIYNEEAGIHAHFEIRKGNEPVNPLDFFEKSLTSLKQEEIKMDETQETSADKEADKEAANEEGNAADEEESDKEKSADEEKPEEGEGDAENNKSDTPDASIGQAKA